MRISDWSSDVCSSDLQRHGDPAVQDFGPRAMGPLLCREGFAGRSLAGLQAGGAVARPAGPAHRRQPCRADPDVERPGSDAAPVDRTAAAFHGRAVDRVETQRSEEHTSELQSLMRISYAVFCLKKKK